MFFSYWFRFVTYIIILAAAFWIYRKQHKRVDLYLIGFALLGITVDVLDQYVFESNLELYSIYRVIASGLIFMILWQFQVNKRLLIAVFGIIFVATMLALTLEDFGWTNSELNFTSVYGLMTTDESADLRLLTNLLTLIPLFFGLSSLLSKSFGYRPTNAIILTSAFLIGSSIDVYLNILVKFLYSHYETYIAVAGAALSIRFLTQHALLLFAILWKRL